MNSDLGAAPDDKLQPRAARMGRYPYYSDNQQPARAGQQGAGTGYNEQAPPWGPANVQRQEDKKPPTPLPTDELYHCILQRNPV